MGYMATLVLADSLKSRSSPYRYVYRVRGMLNRVIDMII